MYVGRLFEDDDDEEDDLDTKTAVNQVLKLQCMCVCVSLIQSSSGGGGDAHVCRQCQLQCMCEDFLTHERLHQPVQSHQDGAAENGRLAHDMQFAYII